MQGMQGIVKMFSQPDFAGAVALHNTLPWARNLVQALLWSGVGSTHTDSVGVAQ